LTSRKDSTLGSKCSRSRQSRRIGQQSARMNLENNCGRRSAFTPQPNHCSAVIRAQNKIRVPSLPSIPTSHAGRRYFITSSTTSTKELDSIPDIKAFRSLFLTPNNHVLRSLIPLVKCGDRRWLNYPSLPLAQIFLGLQGGRQNSD